jgi:DNA-binding winged helix-turn-helix (wHTH) protein
MSHHEPDGVLRRKTRAGPQGDGEWRFGQFTVDTRTHEVRGNGRVVRLAEKPFLVLAALLENAGELVTREELHRRLWADETFVDFDNNLNTAVASLRELLGDSARSPRYIETLPRLGYRLIAAVEPPHQGSSTSVPTETGRNAPRAVLAFAVTVVVLVLGALVGFVWTGKPAPFRWHTTPQAGPARGSPAYADGAYLLEQSNPDGLRRATELLARAVSEDPGHADAHAALAEAWLRLALGRLVQTEAGFAQAESHAQRAMEIDQSVASSHRTMAMIRLHRDWDLSAAARERDLALLAKPTDARNHIVSAMVSAAGGQFEEAVAQARRAIELDPANVRLRADLPFFLLAAGDLEETAAECQRILTLQPDHSAALDFLLAASERLRRFEQAQEAALRLMRLGRATPVEVARVRTADAPASLRLYREWQVRVLEERAAKSSWPATTVAAIYAVAGRTDSSFAWLERAYRTREPMLVFLVANPDLAGIRHDPRFADLARRVGVPVRQPS